MAEEQRIFMLDGQRLPDLDPTKTPEQIRDLHAADNPKLTNATVVTSIKEGRRVHEFKAPAGTKG